MAAGRLSVKSPSLGLNSCLYKDNFRAKVIDISNSQINESFGPFVTTDGLLLASTLILDALSRHPWLDMSGNTAEPSLDPPAEACTQANIRREEEILRLVSFAWKEGFPPSVKEKREYYINQVKQAAMHFQDKTKCLEAALCLYRAFKVWPGTYRQLVLHWCKLVPEPILEILGSMLAHDPSVGEKAMGEHLAIYVLHTGGPERRKVQNPPLTPNETFINALAVCEEAFPGLVPASVADVDTEK